MPATVSIDWERTLSTKGSTRGTGYAASNKIITQDGLIHAGWLDTFGINRVQTLDSGGQPVTEPITVGEGPDNHCGHAITVDQEGHLHWIVGRHHRNPFLHRRSRFAVDARWWSEPNLTGGDNPTYPSIVCDKENTLHLVYRLSYHTPHEPKNYNPSFTLAYQRKLDGHPWTPPVDLVVADTPDGYTQFGASLTVDIGGRVHLGFHIYDDTKTKRGHTLGYLVSADCGNTWTKADGKEMPLPAGKHTADILESSDDIDVRVSNVVADSQSHPHLLACHRETGDNVLWSHDGSEWSSTGLLSALRQKQPNRAFSMDCCISIDGSDNLYVSTQVVDDPSQWGDVSSEVVLLFRPGGDDGFQVLPISEPDPTTPNWLPNLERIASSHQSMSVPHLLYTHGTRGVGCESEDYNDIRLVQLALS